MAKRTDALSASSLLRMPQDLKDLLVDTAKRLGISVNELMLRIVVDGLPHFAGEAAAGKGSSFDNLQISEQDRVRTKTYSKYGDEWFEKYANARSLTYFSMPVFDLVSAQSTLMNSSADVVSEAWQREINTPDEEKSE